MSLIAAGDRYSLWLMPAGDVRNRLAGLIDWLSACYGAPQFPPHVTLLGSCVGARREVVRQAAAVAAACRPFVIRLEAIDFLDEYYRCLFARAALTAPLRQAHRVTCRVFGHDREPAFMPHLSLLYGNFSPSLKKRLVAELGPRLDIKFPVRSLHLYRTQGEPFTWHQVARFGLE
jgi:2'-5' RNA ligase